MRVLADELVAIILAAGQGKRMRSELPKVLHRVAGRPMIQYVIDLVRGMGFRRVIVVTGHRGQEVRAEIGPVADFVEQTEQLGTAHAVLQTRILLGEHQGGVVVLYGDMPLLTEVDVIPLIRAFRDGLGDAVMLTCELDDPTGYGRVVRGRDGTVLGVVEDSDAVGETKSVREVNAGVYCFNASQLFRFLEKVSPRNVQGEYYLTDVLELMARAGGKLTAIKASNPVNVMGVNSRLDLARADAIVRGRIIERLMGEGVGFVDPNSSYIDWGVEVGSDTLILPGTFLEGKTIVEENVVVGPFARITNSIIRKGARLSYCVITDSEVGCGASVGPFTHLRPGCTIGDGCKIGNFAEIKGSTVGPGSKIPHHCYVGDSEVGSMVNIGAGAVTVNYDGIKKHRTRIGDRAFIGCNANLIAPVQIGEFGYIAAGSTISKDVPRESLGVARAKQKNREGWVKSRLKAKESPEG